jgi:hypothetical protein
MNKRKSVITLILMLMVLAFTIVPAGAAPTSLVGTTNYYTYAVNSEEVLQDEDCPATAELVFLDDQQFELALTENGICGGRTTVLSGEMTPDGELQVWFPEPLMVLEDGTALTIQDVVMGHIGCTSLDGPFPVFDGSFDGQDFYADSTFDCEIPEHWPANDLFETPVDGLLNFKWTYDLTMATLPETGGGAFPVQAVLMGLGGLAVAAGVGAQWLRRRWL